MPGDPDLTRLLRLCATLDWNEDRSRRLTDAANRVTTWHDLAWTAEAHGLAPLVAWRLADAGIEPPPAARQELFALKCLHEDANRVRFRVLGQALRAFAAEDLPVVVLKGAALAHLIFPSPGLRPLSDIDLLIERTSAERALGLLREIGLVSSWSPRHWPAVEHHHLPAAVGVVDGVEVRVELHVNALSLDAPASLTMDELTEPPQRLTIDGQAALTLGHTDMLWHLCRHLAEPARLVRLIWMVDIVEYASRHGDVVIAWSDSDSDWRHHFILNTLALLHPLTELPPPLRARLPLPGDSDLRGVGIGLKPLSEIFARRPVRDVWRDVFDPSDWWLRLYYGLDTAAPMWWYRTVRHPLQVGRWLARRAHGSSRAQTR